MATAEAVALVRQAPAVIVPRSLPEMIDLAERLAKSSLLPEALRGKSPEILMQMMAGQELGLYPMAALRSFDFFQGKPRMIADAMVAVVLSSGKAEYFRRVGEGSDKSVTYVTKRRGDDDDRTCTWTIEMAKTASLNTKDNWRGYPRSMLAARAKAELARDVYPDVLAGVYTPDELDGEAPRESPSSSGPPRPEVIDAEFTEQPSEPTVNLADYPEIAEIETAETIEALKAIAAKFAARKLGPGPAYEAINARYKARLQWIKAQKVADPVPTEPITDQPVGATPSEPT